MENPEVKYKKADELLRKSANDYQTLLDTIPHGIQEIDTSGRIIFVNKAYNTIFGYEEGELIGTSILDKLVNDSKRDELRSYLKRLLKDQPTPTPFFEKNRTKKGRIIDVQVDWNYKRDNQGRIVGFISVLTDITDRKQAETKLIEMKDYLDNIIENSLDPIVVTDSMGYVTLVNKSFPQLLGYTKEEVIGKHVAEFSPIKEGSYQSTTGELIQINEEFFNLVKTSMSRLVEKGAIHHAMGYHIRKDNKLVPVEDSIVSLYNKEGERIGAVAIIRDITERRSAEKKLIEHQNQLRSLASQITLSEERERRYLADSLHDEIGQQLFGIKIKLEMLKDSLSSTGDAKTLDNILNNIQQVIEHSRSLTIELSSPILFELGFEKALEWLAEQILNNYGIMVTIEDDKQEKPLDDDMKIFLYKAVRELLTNVAKHAQVKNARVSVKKDNSNIRICVEDGGVGFTYSHKGLSKEGKASFGLFSIIERLDYLGGQLEIQSQPNRGTSITLVAPLSSSI